MKMLRGMWLRVRRLLGWRQAERDIEDELRFHVEMQTEAHVREGMDPAEARRRALAEFGGEDRWREETRGARATRWIEDGLRDARFSVRGLLRSPTFSLAALGTITLGVGATTAVFSVVDGIVLAPLPFPDSDELVTVWMHNPPQGIEEDITSWPNFVDWREGSSSVERMAAVRGARYALTGAGDPEELFGASVSRGFFELIGAPLALGRGFRDDEVEGDLVRVVVLSHELFTRRFGADPTLVGRTIQLNDEAWEVIGVTAPGARYPRDAELWTPMSFSGGLAPLREARGALWLPVIGRLADGVDLAQAQAELDGVAARLEEAYPEDNEGVGIKLESLRQTLVGDVRAALLVLLGAVGLVLLLSVVNVANLLLVRGSSRMRELSVRLALGAGKGRILRQVLADSVVLGVVGGLAGAAVAAAAVAGLVELAPAGLPRLDELHVDARVLGFALLIAVGSGMLFGILPALHAARVDFGAQLREGTRGSSSGLLARIRGAFVVGQFALALLLLVGAGLFVRSFVNLRSVEPGFDPESVLSATVSLPAQRYPDGVATGAFRRELDEGLSALPGVRAVGTVSTFFLSALPNMGGITVEGRPELAEQTREFPVVQDVVSPGLFEAAGMEVVAGRTFTDADGPESVAVAVVNESFVRVYFSGTDPIGRRFLWGSSDGEGDPPWITIVGVVADARRSGVDRPVRPSGFIPASQAPQSRMDVLVRTASDPLVVMPEVRRVVSSIDPQLPLTRVRTLEQAMSESLSQRRFIVGVLTSFAAAALTLAAIGIFGVMAYLVGQRTREIGIRVALGAQRASVLRQIFAEGMTHAAVGLALGLIASLGLTRFMRSQLFGLEPSDPATIAAAVLLLLTTATAACLIPARRAARVDPVVALRED
jgi:putative ABC transport system permease protein